MLTADRAQELFQQGYNCSQAVFAAVGPELGIEKETCLKVAAAFGGGIARTGGACGAVTGALMALGVRFGDNSADPKVKAEIYRRAQAFLAEFTARNGSTTCKELLGCDLGTPEGMQYAKERDFHHTLCPRFVGDAVEILQEMLA